MRRVGSQESSIHEIGRRFRPTPDVPPQMHLHRITQCSQKHTDILALPRLTELSVNRTKSVSQNCTGKELQRVVGSFVVRVTARPQYRTVGCVKTVRMRIERPVISDCLQLHSNSQSFRTACNISQNYSHFGLPATSVKFTVISRCLQHQSNSQSFRTACNSAEFTVMSDSLRLQSSSHYRTVESV